MRNTSLQTLPEDWDISLQDLEAGFERKMAGWRYSEILKTIKKYLDLSYNLFESLPEYSFANMKKIRVIQLQNNLFLKSISDPVFNQLKPRMVLKRLHSPWFISYESHIRFTCRILRDLKKFGNSCHTFMQY